MHDYFFIGERKRKILCSRESDRVVVSDQRCHGTARPAVITEPCNTECELRFVLPTSGLFQPLDYFLVTWSFTNTIFSITRDEGGMWLVRASAQPSVAWDTVPWKYTVPKSTAQTVKPRRLMTATVAISTNLMTRKVAMETVTQVAGSTHLGQR